MPAHVKLKDTVCLMLFTFGQCVCTNVPSLHYLPKFCGLPSQILWLAASFWLSQSLRWRRMMGEGWWLEELFCWPAIPFLCDKQCIQRVAPSKCPLSFDGCMSSLEAAACILLGSWAGCCLQTLPCEWKHTYLIPSLWLFSVIWMIWSHQVMKKWLTFW